MSSSSLPSPPQDGVEQRDQPTLPTFTSTRPHPEGLERAESSASGSLRSNDQSQEYRSVGSGSRSKTRENGSLTDRKESPTFRRHSHRSSGGFLLDSIGRSSRIPRLLHKTQDDVKGKRKNEDSELSVPKRRQPMKPARPSSSIGGSPLATEVKGYQNLPREDGNANTIAHGNLSRSPLPSTAGTDSMRESSEQPSLTSRIPAPNMGFDTDPAQIVNMALSLSEARKRQASARRYVSSDQRGNRVTSGVPDGVTTIKPSGGSLAEYLKPQRPSSRGSRDDRPQSSRPETRSTSKSMADPFVNDDEPKSMVDGVLDEDSELSHATAARIQKAKTYFELAYEHRRLLPHLPPVRRPGASARARSPDSSSKEYNPLQYIRNRKLRIWDKSAINAEAEGWHDVEKVRKWVDAVIEGHTETRHDPAEVIRLPPLSHQSSENNPHHLLNGKDMPRTPEQNPRPRRPRSDWVTHPGDLIADCSWLEQGLNKTKILDRDNNQIYPPGVHLKFAGWRNRAPIDVPMDLQQPTPPPEEDPFTEQEDTEPLHEPAPELPVFKSASHAFGRSLRGRKRDRFKGSKGAGNDEISRRKGLKGFMDDSDSGSDSSRSPGLSEDEMERGRKRLSKKRLKVQSSEGSPATTSLRNHLSHDSGRQSNKSRGSSGPNSKRASIDHSHFSKFLKRDSKSHTPSNGSKDRAGHGRQESTHKFPSFHDHPRSSAEYESTAPNSPAVATWPSIAINLSPPHSRSPSPTKRSIPSKLNPFKDRSHSRHSGVTTTDFAEISLSKHSSRQASGEKDEEDSNPASREPSPLTRGQSPMTRTQTQSTVDSAMAPVQHRDSTASRTSGRSAAKSTNEHSKIRGMFKGGRIAEIVGTEVHRVGDFIWKRDLPAGYRRRGSTSDGSVRSYTESEDDAYVNGTVVKTPTTRPPNYRTRSSTISTNKSEKSPEVKSSPSSGEQPGYHNPNLPSFTSPFERDKEAQDKKQQLSVPTSSPDTPDHISRQAAEHRSASRSPRLNKLAPPKLETGRHSPERPDGLSRLQSYGFSEGLRLSRSRDASDKLNTALNGRPSPSPSSIRLNKSGLDLSRLSSRDLFPEQLEHQNINQRDIERASVLVYSSAVKAREIGIRANTPRGFTPKYLLQSVADENKDAHLADLSMVSRREEHVVAARNIMSTLSNQAHHFDVKLKHFSTVLAPSLHTKLQTLEDLVDNRMTPRVRNTADEAGKLSMQLTTTSTMAVKEVNDTIDGAIRRRRRGPIRWVSKLWYASIEYTVVSLLWGIWAVVSIIRVVLAIGTGTARSLRWLLWVD